MEKRKKEREEEASEKEGARGRGGKAARPPDLHKDSEPRLSPLRSQKLG